MHSYLRYSDSTTCTDRSGLLAQDQKSDYGSISIKSGDEVDDDAFKSKLSRQVSMRRILPPRQPVTVSWDNLNASVTLAKKGCGPGRRRQVPEKKHILRNVSGCIQSGQLVALMGASGAGKTTLLNTLTYRNRGNLKINGEIRCNGVEVGRQITALSAYVQQDDLFIGTLTVMEHLTFQAYLRLPKIMTWEQKRNRAEQVMYELGLLKCRNTKIGLPGFIKGISGGEKKRLAFAAEVLTDPPILFCDEPTTGLDAYMAQNLISVLQTMAKKGKTILCTIHQPASEVYAMFDRVCFLAEGRVAFFGRADDALTMFSKCAFNCPDDFNPADFFVQTLAIVPGKEEKRRERVEMICDYYASSTYGQEMSRTVDAASQVSDLAEAETNENMSPYKVNFFIQFAVLLKRALLNNFRNPRIIGLKMIQKIVLGLFMGFLYFQSPYNQEGIGNISSGLYFCLMELSMPALFGVIMTFPTQFTVLVKEHHDGMYRVSSYYWSNFLAFIPTYTLDGIIFLTIVYFMIGLRMSVQGYFVAVGILVLVEQSAASFGCLIGSIAPNLPVALTMAGPFITLLQLMGGLFSNVDSVPVFLSWMQWLSWWRYGFEALMINQWHEVHNITCEQPEIACVREGDMLIHSFSFDTNMLMRNCLALLALIIGYHVLAFIALSIRLGLLKCRNTKIGLPGFIKGISGGEKKRLAFAAEVLTDPPILFCDEPTTGLDAYMAQNLISVLQTMAKKGKTILCTIHQPASEVYAMFDRVCFLAEGRVAFFGRADDTLTMFSKCAFNCPDDFNPADFFVQTLAIVPGKEEKRRERVEMICDHYASSTYGQEMSRTVDAASQVSDLAEAETNENMSPYKVNFFIQFAVLLKRALLNNFRNPRIVGLKMIQKIVLGLFMGFLYFQSPYNQEGIGNISSGLYFCLMELSMPALFGVIMTFPTQFTVLVKEHHDGMYRVSSYYWSNFLAFIPTYTLDGIIFLTIVYFMIGLRMSVQGYFVAVGILVLVEQSAASFGCLIGSIAPNLPVALTMAGPFITLLQLMGGLFSNVDSVPVFLSWMQWLSWWKYGFEALMINQWHEAHNITCEQPEIACVREGDMLIHSFSFDTNMLMRNCLALLALIIGYHVLAFIALSIRVRRSR